MSKVILLSRVSTEHQTLEQQTNELLNEAARLGYNKDNIIVIENKESAISLDEEERRGLIRMKEEIENNSDVDCVICYEVSRISRRSKVLFSIRDYLIERRIQLVILKPYMKLLDEDGKMSQTASIMFSLFSSLSESEMMIKKERLTRGKRLSMSKNKYGGGNISLGYKINEDRYIVIDEEKAKTVRKVFNLYLKGWSMQKIGIELMETGELERKKKGYAANNVKVILSSRQYYGDSSKLRYNYPPIISKELFDKCRKVAQEHFHAPKSQVSMVYYGRHLLRMGDNGLMLTPSKSDCEYGHSHVSDVKMHISINAIDSLIWQVVSEYVIYHMPENNEAQKEELAANINTLKDKIHTATNDIKDYEKRITRIEERIISGKLSETRGDKMEIELEEMIKDTNDNISKWMFEINNKENELKELENDIYMMRDLTMLNDEERYELIKKHISKILLWKTDTPALKTADFIFKNGIIKTFKLYTRSKFPKYWDEYGEEYHVNLLHRVPPRKRGSRK